MERTAKDLSYVQHKVADLIKEEEVLNERFKSAQIVNNYYQQSHYSADKHVLPDLYKERGTELWS